MSKWTDPEEWERRRNEASCPVCLNGRPTDAVAELETSFLIASENGPMKGYCFLLYKRHAIELYELSPDEATSFMRDVQRAAKALHEVTQAVKLNYEIHGNTIPHLHLHLFPRYIGDQFENQPINPRIVTEPVYGPGEFTDFSERLRSAITSTRNE